MKFYYLLFALALCQVPSLFAGSDNYIVYEDFARFEAALREVATGDRQTFGGQRGGIGEGEFGGDLCGVHREHPVHHQFVHVVAPARANAPAQAAGSNRPGDNVSTARPARSDTCRSAPSTRCAAVVGADASRRSPPPAPG